MLKTIFNILFRFYPLGFRCEFSEEMHADLVDLQAEYDRIFFFAKIHLLRREILGWFGGITQERIAQVRTMLWQLAASLRGNNSFRWEHEMKNKNYILTEWRLHDRKQSLIASLPPLLYGGSIWLTWLVIGGPWYTASEEQLHIAPFVGLLLCAVIAVGGFIALAKRLPAWGFTWLGTNVIAFLLVGKMIVEISTKPIPSWFSNAIMAATALFVVFILITAVLKSWQAAGLVSLGMSSCLTLNCFHFMAIGPFHRVDLVWLSLASGLVFSWIIYTYTQSRIWVQTALLVLTGVINAAILALANHVWTPQMGAEGGPSPLIPLLVIALILLLAGPISGLFHKPIDKLFGKYFRT